MQQNHPRRGCVLHSVQGFQGFGLMLIILHDPKATYLKVMVLQCSEVMQGCSYQQQRCTDLRVRGIRISRAYVHALTT